MDSTHTVPIKPMLLSGPVVSSRVSWAPRNEYCEIESVLTSVDRGTSWQEAANGAPVPGLKPGDELAEVQAKARVRLTGSGPKWSMPDWNVKVVCDISAGQAWESFNLPTAETWAAWKRAGIV